MSPLFLLLLVATTVAVADAATCSPCPFTANSASVQSNCTASDNLALSCAGDELIKSGQSSFDNFACVDNEWYGLTCDGKVTSLGGSVAVTCPLTCAQTCSSITVPSSESSTATCLDGKEMRTCPSGDLSIETDSGTFSYNKAVCMGGDKWIGFNCDGTAKMINGALKARCTPACTTCVQGLIVVSQDGADSKQMDNDVTSIVDGCSARTFTCTGRSATIKVYGVDGASLGSETDGGSGLASLSVTCNGVGTAWEYFSKQVGRVECTVAPEPTTTTTTTTTEAPKVCPALTDCEWDDIKFYFSGPTVVYGKATLTLTEATCPAATPKIVYLAGHNGGNGQPMAITATNARCRDGEWIMGGLTIKPLLTTKVCCVGY